MTTPTHPADQGAPFKLPLSPCPCCGGVPAFDDRDIPNTRCWEALWIACPDCGMRTREYDYNGNNQEAVNLATAAWNTRAPLPGEALVRSANEAGELAQRVAELEKDKARLDWLEANRCARFMRDTEGRYYLWPNVDNTWPTHRAAIDAAQSTLTAKESK